MTPSTLARELTRNQSIVNGILRDQPLNLTEFRPSNEEWSMLMVICHLRDEEVEDFRSRIQFMLTNPEAHPPAIDPENWPIDRNYESQSFTKVLVQWNQERTRSIEYLNSLLDIDVTLGFDHQRFGRYTVQLLLDNWLAHDLLHIRQLTRLRYQYLQHIAPTSLVYAGKW